MTKLVDVLLSEEKNNISGNNSKPDRMDFTFPFEEKRVLIDSTDRSGTPY